MNAYNPMTVHAVFDISVNGGPRSYFPNIVPLAGRNMILDLLLHSLSKPSNWYLAPFAGNVTPADSWTAANFAANATEFTNYTESSRPELVVVAADAGAINNYASRGEITVDAGTDVNDLVIRGIGVLTSGTKSGTTGFLLSAARLPSDRPNLVEGDVISLGFSLSLSNGA